VICAYIDAFRDRFGVEPICRVLSEHSMKIAPQTYYAWRKCPLSNEALDEAYLINELVTLHRANRRLYGVRKLWHTARRAGLEVGRDQVARLMRVVGLRGVRRGSHRTTTTERAPGTSRFPDRVQRDWDGPTRPDQLWVADFTYVWTAAGFVYVSFVTDVYSRRILGWTVATSKHVSLVTSALDQALASRHRSGTGFTAEGLIHHSDAGSQYTALAFTEQLLEAGILGSIGTVGDALDNALMESTIGLYKCELIDLDDERRNWSGRLEVERETAEWVHWYNHQRLHSSIGYSPPIEYEARYAATLAHQGQAA
jgi:transposase InsO family protein